MCRALIVAIKKCMRFAMRNRQIGRSCIVDESNQLSPGQQLQPNLNNLHESVSVITCMLPLLTCFSRRQQRDYPDDATEEAPPDDCNNLRSVWFARADPTTSTADRNNLTVHASMQYAIFF